MEDFGGGSPAERLYETVPISGALDRKSTLMAVPVHAGQAALHGFTVVKPHPLPAPEKISTSRFRMAVSRTGSAILAPVRSVT